MERVAIPRNSLVVLCGPAGCGKSSFAAKHFLRTQVVSSDDCRALVSDDPTNQKVSHHAFDLMHFIIVKRLYLGRLTVADATHLQRDDRRFLINMAGWYKFNTVALVFNLPLETCLKRNAARERVVPEETVKNQYELLLATLGKIEQERFDHLFVIDEAAQEKMRIEIGPFNARRPGARSGSDVNPQTL